MIKVKVIKFDFLFLVLKQIFGVSSKAIALKRVILFHSQYVDIEWLYEHKMSHIHHQHAEGFFKWLWNYLTDKEYKFEAEVQAHAVEIIHGRPFHKSVDTLYANYNHGKSYMECHTRLVHALNKLRMEQDYD